MSLIILVEGIIGCEDRYDDEPPAVPRGVISITGDGYVRIEWIPNEEYDLEGYHVYWNDRASGVYEYLGSTHSNIFIDRDVQNGKTYYYAVSAYDYSGNESDLSDTVFDTPRPEGRNVTLWDDTRHPNEDGYHFSSTGAIQRYDDPATDIYFIYDGYGPAGHRGYMGAVETDPPTQIQDCGYMDSLEEINYAPEGGWSYVGEVELIVGHAYVVWTWDNYFASFRAVDLGERYVVFDWAYQTDKGNPELKIVPTKVTVQPQKGARNAKGNIR